MTLIEIRKEIEKDFPIVVRKADFLEHKLTRETRPHGKDSFVRVYDYLSKYKNNWLIRIETRRRVMGTSFLVYYYNNIGLAGITVSPDEELLGYYTSHFFKRFNQRLALNLTKPNEIMKAFINECFTFHGRNLDVISPGIYKTVCATQKGYCLGIMDENKKFLRINTFITKDMLKEGQVPLADQLNQRMEKFINEHKNFQF